MSNQSVYDWRDERQEPVDEKPPCNVCNSRRFIIDLKGNLLPCPSCRVAQDLKAERMSAYSSKAGKSKTQTFETFKALTPALGTLRDIVFEFSQDPHNWIVIYGDAGNGKTHLCAATYNEIIRLWHDCLFSSMPDLIASLKSLFDEETRAQERESYQQRLQVYQRAAVLILDDLGSERQTEWTAGVLFELLDYRYRNQLATMLSTNLDPRDRAVFDARLISRWQDAQFSAIYRNTARDYRASVQTAGHEQVQSAKTHG